MNRLAWTLASLAANLLREGEREAVLGDLVESGETGFGAVSDVLGLALRRQLLLWKRWQPWVAAVGVAMPGSLLLMGVSLDSFQAWRHGLPAHPAAGLERGLLLAAWAWAAGRLVAFLSRRTLWASLLAAAAPCAYCLSRFRVPETSPLSLLLFLIPAVWGVLSGVRSDRPSAGLALPLAVGTTGITFALLAASGSIAGPCVWVCSGLRCLPAWYLVGAARGTHRLARWGAAFLALGALSGRPLSAAVTEASRVVDASLKSEHLAHSKIGTNPVRRLSVYVPPGYDGSAARLPVIYFFPNTFGDYRACFDQNQAQALFDRAIAEGVIGRFLFVTVDMNTPIGCSWYVNSPVTGDWEAFVTDDLVPYVDGHFRTLANRDSRGLCGDFMGGYGALRIGMEHPEMFGSVYALHPVGTGSGILIMHSRPNWDLLAKATSLEDVKKDGLTQLFTAIFQAHLPDVDKPPLYIDLAARREGGQLVIDARQTERLREAFFIESLVPRYADNLKSLRGLKFDWARSDANQDHVYSNQALTHKLNEFGIVHEAEEYNGTWGEQAWGEDGRVETELLPFFKRHLVAQR